MVCYCLVVYNNASESLRILLDDGLQLGVTFSDIVLKTDFSHLVEKYDHDTLAMIKDCLNTRTLSELVENIHNLTPSLLKYVTLIECIYTCRRYYNTNMDTLYFNEDKFTIFKTVIIPLKNINFSIEV
jgi:hypothetical protein